MCGIAGAYQQVDGEEADRVMADASSTAARTQAGSFSYEDERVHVQFAPPPAFDHRSPATAAAVGQATISRSATTASSTTTGRSGPNCSVGGASFATTSDTEVVLEAWRRWGPAACAVPRHVRVRHARSSDRLPLPGP